MGNTYSTDLVTQSLKEGAITKLVHAFAPLRAFTRDFTTDPIKPRSTCQVKLITTSGAAQDNPTNFETGDTTVSNVAVTVDQVSRSFHVTNDELNSGLRLTDLLVQNGKVFAGAIQQKINALFTTGNFANYSGGAYTKASASFAWSDMALLWGALKKADEKHAILDGEYLGPLVNSPTFMQPGLTADASQSGMRFGWDGLHLCTEWTGAEANVRGIICNPQAIVAVAGVPVPAPAANIVRETFVIPGIGLTVSFSQWFSLATRTLWASYDCMFGCSVGDNTALILIKSA